MKLRIRTIARIKKIKAKPEPIINDVASTSLPRTKKEGIIRNGKKKNDKKRKRPINPSEELTK